MEIDQIGSKDSNSTFQDFNKINLQMDNQTNLETKITQETVEIPSDHVQNIIFTFPLRIKAKKRRRNPKKNL